MENKLKYQVALSFASEDREYVELVAGYLKARGIELFYYELLIADIWGKNLTDYLDEVYRKDSRYVVMFISKYYVAKAYTNYERKAAQAKALDNPDYILPARFDDSEVAGLFPTIAYIDLRKFSAEQFSKIILNKLGHKTEDLIKKYTELGESLKQSIPNFHTTVRYEDGKNVISLERTDGQPVPFGITPVESASGVINNFFSKGLPAELSAKEIFSLNVPIELAPYVNKDSIDHIKIERKVDPTKSFRVRIELHGKEDKSILDNITLRPRYVGLDQATFDNVDDNSPIKITFRPQLNNDRSEIVFEYHTKGSVKENLSSLRFIQMLSHGGMIAVVNDENDITISQSSFPKGSFDRPEDQFVSMFEDLMRIQKEFGITFNLPERHFTIEELDSISRLSQILSFGFENLVSAKIKGKCSKEFALSFFENIKNDDSFQFEVRSIAEPIHLFGKEIFLGEEYLNIPKAVFSRGVDNFETSLSSGAGEIEVEIELLQGTTAVRHYQKFVKH